MDSHYLQTLRFQLQKRVRRLNSCHYEVFHSLQNQFWHYLQSHEIFKGILLLIENSAPPFTEELNGAFSGNEYFIFDNEEEHLHFCYRIVKACVNTDTQDGRTVYPELEIGRAYTGSGREEGLEQYRENILEPFYEHLDEALDQQTADLLARMASDTVRAEKLLARDLYAYLHDQGLEFEIEPASASGEIDLLAENLLLDAKIFDGASRNVSYLLKGFKQVHTYSCDYNQHVGYLAIFKTCEEDLHFEFATAETLVPFVLVGDKLIYLLVIDIHDHQKSASKRGKLSAHVIQREQFRSMLEVEV